MTLLLAQARSRFNFVPHRAAARWLRMAGAFALLWLGAGCRDAETGEAPRRTWSFPAGDAKTVLVRSWRAREMRVAFRSGKTIEISARPKLWPNSQHGREPDGRAIRAHEWAFSWNPIIEGTTLVLTGQGEARFPHHRYVLEELTVTIPPGLKVQGERKELPARQDE